MILCLIIICKCELRAILPCIAVDETATQARVEPCRLASHFQGLASDFCILSLARSS